VDQYAAVLVGVAVRPIPPRAGPPPAGRRSRWVVVSAWWAGRSRRTLVTSQAEGEGW